MPDVNASAEYWSATDRRALAHAHALHEAAEWLIRRHAATDPAALRHAAALRAAVDFVWRVPDPATQQRRQAAADRLRKDRQRAKAAEPGGEVQP